MGLYRRACVYTQRERTGRRERGEEERENTHTTQRERQRQTDRQTEKHTHHTHLIKFAQSVNKIFYSHSSVRHNSKFIYSTCIYSAYWSTEPKRHVSLKTYVQIVSPMCIIWWFYQYLCKRSTFWLRNQ